MGGTVNINDCDIHDNQASIQASTHTCFEQRAHHNAPMEGVSTKVPDCPDCSQGGGIYIEDGDVNIISSTINNNVAGSVRTPVP